MTKVIYIKDGAEFCLELPHNEAVDRYTQKSIDGKDNFYIATDDGASYPIHSVAGPAWVSDRVSCWFKNGVYHNTRGPAILEKDGGEVYYLEGKIISKSEFLKNSVKITYKEHLTGAKKEIILTLAEEKTWTKTFWGNNKHYVWDGDNWCVISNSDGPAFESEDVTMWIEDGNYHNLKGPAIVRKDGTELFYKNSVAVNKEEIYGIAQIPTPSENVVLHLKASVTEPPQELSVSDSDFIKMLCDSPDGKYQVTHNTEVKEIHNVSGPALIDNGRVHWIQNGYLHRIDGPAYTSDTKFYKEFWVFGHVIDQDILMNNQKYFNKLSMFLEHHEWEDFEHMFVSKKRLIKCIKEDKVCIKIGNKFKYHKLDDVIDIPAELIDTNDIFIEKDNLQEVMSTLEIAEPPANTEYTDSQIGWGLPIAMLALIGVFKAAKNTSGKQKENKSVNKEAAEAVRIVK